MIKIYNDTSLIFLWFFRSLVFYYFFFFHDYIIFIRGNINDYIKFKRNIVIVVKFFLFNILIPRIYKNFCSLLNQVIPTCLRDMKYSCR